MLFLFLSSLHRLVEQWRKFRDLKISFCCLCTCTYLSICTLHVSFSHSVVLCTVPREYNLLLGDLPSNSLKELYPHICMQFMYVHNKSKVHASPFRCTLETFFSIQGIFYGGLTARLARRQDSILCPKKDSLIEAAKAGLSNLKNTVVI